MPVATGGREECYTARSQGKVKRRVCPPLSPPPQHANVRRVCWTGAVVVGRTEDDCVCGLVAILVFHH